MFSNESSRSSSTSVTAQFWAFLNLGAIEESLFLRVYTRYYCLRLHKGSKDEQNGDRVLLRPHKGWSGVCVVLHQMSVVSGSHFLTLYLHCNLSVSQDYFSAHPLILSLSTLPILVALKNQRGLDKVKHSVYSNVSSAGQARNSIHWDVGETEGWFGVRFG